jgi:hypothetical protein
MLPTQLYLELSDFYDQRGEAQSRDRFLVLAADAALAAGERQEAEALRQRLLALNPHHLLKPFHSFEEALKSRDVADYLNALRRRHPPEQVANLVETTIKLSPKGKISKDQAPHIHVPPDRGEPPVGPPGVEAFRLRKDEPAATTIRPRPAPPPPIPSVPSNPGRGKPLSNVQQTPLSLPPLPLPPEPSRPLAGSPFRPKHSSLPAASIPVYQGPRMAATPGAWFCSLLFFLLLMGGVGIAIFTMGRVFLPDEIVPARFLGSRE